MTVALHNGQFVDTASSANSLVRVAVPSINILGNKIFGPLPFEPRITSDGAIFWPKEGDNCIIAVDDAALTGAQWIVRWAGGTPAPVAPATGVHLKARNVQILGPSPWEYDLGDIDGEAINGLEIRMEVAIATTATAFVRFRPNGADITGSYQAHRYFRSGAAFATDASTGVGSGTTLAGLVIGMTDFNVASHLWIRTLIWTPDDFERVALGDYANIDVANSDNFVSGKLRFTWQDHITELDSAKIRVDTTGSLGVGIIKSLIVESF